MKRISSEKLATVASILTFCLAVELFVVSILTFELYEKLAARPEKMVIRKEGIEPVEVTMTAYSPSPHITDSDPFLPASGKRVTPQDLWELRYVALSRDLMGKYGVEYGDVIYIGFEVQDCMNARVKNTVDIFLRNLTLARNFGKQTRKMIILEGE